MALLLDPGQVMLLSTQGVGVFYAHLRCSHLTQSHEAICSTGAGSKHLLWLVPNPDSLLTVNRVALVQQQEEDEFSEGADLVDLPDNEFLCPVCRRLGNTLLPALTTPSPPLHPSGLPPQAGLLLSQAEILARSSEEGEH